MVSLDGKQQRLISAWIGYGTGADRDHYGRFISLWVAFNAICYALYARVANQNRADLRQDRGLTEATDEPKRLEGTMLFDSGHVKLEIDQPGKIIITVSERYTEDIIYVRFAKEFQGRYIQWLSDANFRSEVVAFREAIKKSERYYVINMARASEHTENSDYEDMKRRGIIMPFEDLNDLRHLKNVMYQVRNNVFHVT